MTTSADSSVAGRSTPFRASPKALVKVALLVTASLGLATLLAGEISNPETPEVPYPDGYRNWRHISSAVMPPKQGATNNHPEEEKIAAPHGLIHHIYANEKALEGYRTGHFPEGAVLIADWFVLEQKGPELVQGSRKSINVMVRDARYTATGGWGFEDFDKDSHTTRNVRQNAVKMCFECHSRVKDREYVFSRPTK
jgi:hypothetical protein